MSKKKERAETGRKSAVESAAAESAFGYAFSFFFSFAFGRSAAGYKTPAEKKRESLSAFHGKRGRRLEREYAGAGVERKTERARASERA